MLDVGGDLRRRPRCHDPLHRDECGRHRRVADHVLDGELPPAARGAPPAASALQDAVALARDLRGDRADPRDPARGRELRRDALLARGDALVHDRARRARPAPDGRSGRGRGRDRLPRAAEPARRPDGAAGLRDPGWSRDRYLVPRARRGEPDDAVGRARLDDARAGRVPRLPAALGEGSAGRDREGTTGLRPCARARVPADPRARRRRAAVRRGARRGVPAGGQAIADRRADRARGPARPAARRRRTRSSRSR